jgi:hypothetical protein
LKARDSCTCENRRLVRVLWLDSHNKNKHSRVECGGWIATRNKHSRVECGGWIATKSSTVGCWLDSHKSQNYISLAPRRLRSPVEP